MLQSAFGLLVLVGLAWLLSENRRKVSLRVVAVGLALQIGVALALTRIPAVEQAFLQLNRLVRALEAATTAGTTFVFGYLGGGPLPFAETYPGAAFIFAFRSLPLILVMSALSALLFHWRILPAVVRGLSFLLQRTMRVGGALAVSVGANIFMGMIEAPLLIRPYLNRMTRSELFTVMTAGMATVAGTIFVLYASILGPVIPGALGHLLIASIISAPAAILVSQVMVPETEPLTTGEVTPPVCAVSSMDAVTRGTAEGVTLLLNVLAMLVVLVALVALANMILGLLPDVAGQPLSLQRMAGWVLAPLAWLLGVPWSEAPVAGELLGVKVVLNELIAYVDLAKLPAGVLSERSRLILVYAMCGFANLGSLGIMIGGLRAMAPERHDVIVGLGAKSILAGLLASCMTGAVIGLLM